VEWLGIEFGGECLDAIFVDSYARGAIESLARHKVI
jgi:hypothetical protein